MRKNFKDQYGPWALVLGSVEGMGACYAERFAAAGLLHKLAVHGGDRIQRPAFSGRNCAPAANSGGG